MSSTVPAIFLMITSEHGAAVFGSAGFFSTINDIGEVQSFIDVFLRHGHSTHDTARGYGGGTSEEVIWQLDIKKCKVDTKIYPSQPGAFSASGVRGLVAQSQSIGRRENTNIVLASARSKEGHFELFGLSNFYAWEVAEIVTVCRLNGYVQPTVYQGIYNALDSG